MAKRNAVQTPRFWGVFQEGRTKGASWAIAWFSSREAAERAMVKGTVVIEGEQIYGEMFIVGKGV